MFLDYGLFEEMAVVLARYFKKVLYYVPYRTAFPKSSLALIGKGFEGVTRIPDEEAKEPYKDFFDYAEEADTLIFPDILDGDLQVHFRKLGKAVWGSGHADRLEIDRWGFRKLQKKLGMPIPKTLLVHGIDELKETLKGMKDVYIKIALWRGDIESHHFWDWKTSEEKIEEWEYRLGAKKSHIDFLIEEAVPGVEVGYDGFSILGKFPTTGAYGYEVKGCSYVGRICPYNEIPEPIRWINEKMSGEFKRLGLMGSYSNEIRIGKSKKPYLIDPCIRMGSPPSECLVEVFSNLPEFIYEGARGKLIELKPIAKYMALARICTSEALDNWVTIDFPDYLRRYVKLRNATFMNGKYQIVPSKLDTVGSLIGFGDTIEDAVKMVKDNADKIHGTGVSVYTKELDDAVEEAEKGKKFGIDF